MKMNLLIFYGSVRDARQGIKAARFIEHTFRKRGYDVALVDPCEYDFGLLNWMYKEYDPGTAPEKMEELAEMIRKADGFLVVSGEYNNSIPPALTNLMDHYLEEYGFRPSGIITYSSGRLSGIRAAMQLRAYLGEIGTVTIPTIFPIANVQDTFTESGEPVNKKYHDFITQFADEFEWYCKTLRDGRDNHELPY
ncbi:MAG: NADPH-dependent FMN reductase [Spirochaetota bacterium]